MLNWIWKVLPSEWKFSVALKKATWTVAKTGVSLLAATKLGKEISPENWLTVTEVSAALMAGGLKVIHDWARLKYPTVKWL